MADPSASERPRKADDSSAASVAALKSRTVSPLRVRDVLDASTKREWRDWLPETIRAYVGLSDDDVQQLDKILAVQAILTNDDVFDTWHFFHACVVALNDRRVNFEWLDYLEPGEMAYGCVMIRSLRPDGAFHQGVLAYVKAYCQHEGLVYFPWVGGDGLKIGEFGEEVAALWRDRDLGKRPEHRRRFNALLRAQLSRLDGIQKLIDERLAA